MNILIIEDEKLAADKLQSIMSEISDSHQIVAVIDSIEDSIEWLRNNSHPDVILSDIHLADGLCFSIYSAVKVKCPIIFTTAYEKYAIQAFEVNSIDYLLKPVQKDRLQLALEKCADRLMTSVDFDIYEKLKSTILKAPVQYKSRFLCKLGNTIKSIETSSVQYFYSQDKITFVVDRDKNRLPINNTLDEIDQMLDPLLFFRINRKYIVCFNGIAEIHTYFKGRLKLKLQPHIEDDIIVSTEKSPVFKAWLDR